MSGNIFWEKMWYLYQTYLIWSARTLKAVLWIKLLKIKLMLNWSLFIRRGIIVYLYIEYQSVCPFVGIGPPTPLPRKQVWLQSRIPVGRDILACLQGRGWGGPIPTKWQKLCYSMSTIILIGIHEGCPLSKVPEKPPAIKTEDTSLQKITFVSFSICVRVIFAHLDPDPDSTGQKKCGSGSTGLL